MQIQKVINSSSLHFNEFEPRQKMFEIKDLYLNKIH
jgi:hypothetical protein